ncbi:MAG: hypothetical protein ACXWBP_00130 [Limisphaerales bacterium]
MKTSFATFPPTRKRRASVLIAVLAMLAIMFILFTVNSKTLTRLSREVDALDKKQTNHLATVRAQATTVTPPK